MNRGHVFQSSPVQQMMAGGPNSWWNISNMRPSPPPQTSPFLAPAPSHIFPQFPQPNSSSWHDRQDQLPESWNQLLLLGGLVGEEDKSTTNSLSNMQAAANKLEQWELKQWEEQLLSQSSSSNGNNSMVDIVKQENSAASSCYAGPPVYSCHGNTAAEFLQATKPTWSPVAVNNNNNNIVADTAAAASSPRSSCVTSLSSSMLDFSNNTKDDGRHPPPERSSECNSTATGGAVKKARVQPSATQSTFKVRKEKLGDRITSLHQLVSPFGKTDTASVLLEAIGYIRFLQSQIEALSLPYFGNGSANMRHQHPGQGERNCLFPEDPGQLLNDNCMKISSGASDQLQNQDSTELEPKKDLRSRGLCLVPLSCTMQVGSDNGADYWAPALNGGFR